MGVVPGEGKQGGGRKRPNMLWEGKMRAKESLSDYFLNPYTILHVHIITNNLSSREEKEHININKNLVKTTDVPKNTI